MTLGWTSLDCKIAGLRVAALHAIQQTASQLRLDTCLNGQTLSESACGRQYSQMLAEGVLSIQFACPLTQSPVIDEVQCFMVALLSRKQRRLVSVFVPPHRT